MSAKDKNEYWFAKVDVAVIRDKSLSQTAEVILRYMELPERRSDMEIEVWRKSEN